MVRSQRLAKHCVPYGSHMDVYMDMDPCVDPSAGPMGPYMNPYVDPYVDPYSDPTRITYESLCGSLYGSRRGSLAIVGGGIILCLEHPEVSLDSQPVRDDDGHREAISSASEDGDYDSSRLGGRLREGVVLPGRRFPTPAVVNHCLLGEVLEQGGLVVGSERARHTSQLLGRRARAGAISGIRRGDR